MLCFLTLAIITQGFTLPGTTVVCGDSHTATHGAFGSLAFGIGTSEVEHVLATQTLLQKRAKNMRIEVCSHPSTSGLVCFFSIPSFPARCDAGINVSWSLHVMCE